MKELDLYNLVIGMVTGVLINDSIHHVEGELKIVYFFVGIFGLLVFTFINPKTKCSPKARKVNIK